VSQSQASSLVRNPPRWCSFPASSYQRARQVFPRRFTLPRWRLGIVSPFRAKASERDDWGAGPEASRIFASNPKGVLPQ
jgi:hypothetical protein